MTIMEHDSIELTSTSQEDLIKRTIGLNAIPIVYPVSASAKLNSAIAVDLRDKLQKKMWSFLVDETAGEEHLIKSQYKKEFLDQKDPSSNSFFLQPYAQTSLLVHECIGLNMTLIAGNIKLVESPGGRKDRFTALSYGNYFASILEKDFLREEDKSDDYDYLAALVQYV